MKICADSSAVECPAHQPGGGGSIPTSALHTFRAEVCNRGTVREFIEKNHYSRSINGVKGSLFFCLRDAEQTLVGAAMFGRLAMHNQFARYTKREEEIVELRRFCCIDDTPKNCESRFLGFCLRWIRRNVPELKFVLSYADLEHGHTGIIYRASNFQEVRRTPPQRVIQWGDRRYHDHTIRTKYKGRLKPFATRVKTALDSGEARYVKTAGKVVYLYSLRS